MPRQLISDSHHTAYIDLIASHLHEDGDTYTEDSPTLGKVTFKLCIEHDDLQVGDMEDEEVFGRYAVRQYRDGQELGRPDDFTGAAVKFDSDSTQGVYFWYEPPLHLRSPKRGGFDNVDDWGKAVRENLVIVRNLLSWGYISIGVKLTHVRPDGYTRSWFASIGGVESGTGLSGQALKDHNAHVAELVREQIGEVLAEVGQLTEAQS